LKTASASVCTRGGRGGAPAAMLEGMDRMGFDLTHVYGPTRNLRSGRVCAQQPDWAELDVGERRAENGRQGVRYPMQEAVSRRDPARWQRCRRPGKRSAKSCSRQTSSGAVYSRTSGDG